MTASNISYAVNESVSVKVSLDDIQTFDDDAVDQWALYASLLCRLLNKLFMNKYDLDIYSI